MKTLNERVYEYLLSVKSCCCAEDLANSGDFADVPLLYINQSLLSLCEEGTVYYSIKNGRYYFSTDSAEGRLTPNKKMASGVPDSVFSFAQLMSMLSNSRSDSEDFPAEENESSKELDQLALDKTLDLGEYKLKIPSKNIIEDDDKDEDDFTVEYDDELINSIGIKKFQAGDRLFEKEHVLAIAMSLLTTVKGQTGYDGMVRVLQEEDYPAVLLPSPDMCSLIIGHPSGWTLITPEWTYEKPGKSALLRFAKRLVKGFEYCGDKKYLVHLHLDRPELLCAKFDHAAHERMKSELVLRYQDLAQVHKEYLGLLTFNENVKHRTEAIYFVRTILERLSVYIDKFLQEMLNVLEHYRSHVTNRDDLHQMIEAFAQVLNPCSLIGADVPFEPYELPTDLWEKAAKGQGNQAVYHIAVFPAHFPQIFSLWGSMIMDNYGDDDNNKNGLREIAQEYAQRYSKYDRKKIHYPANFNSKHGTLKLYMGEDKEVIVPDNVNEIESFAFQESYDLENVVLGDGVQRIGFSAFAYAYDLKVVEASPFLNDIDKAFSCPENITFVGQPGTYAEDYSKTVHAKFQSQEDEDWNCLITLEAGEYDFVQGLSLPRIKNYRTTAQLTNTERNALESEEGTSHLQYAALPIENVGSAGFGGYMDSKFSITIIQDEKEIEDGLNLAEKANYVLTGQYDHLNFRRCDADHGKIISYYNKLKEGMENGIPWASYGLSVFTDNQLVNIQIFINGDYSRRQCELAIHKWARALKVGKC